jgi:hypothetical protein
MLPRGSTTAIVDGNRRSFADSDGYLRKGMVDYRRFLPPLTDSFLREVLGVEAELQELSARLRVASSDGDEHGRARVSVLLVEMSGEEEEWGSGAYPLRRCAF